MVDKLNMIEQQVKQLTDTLATFIGTQKDHNKAVMDELSTVKRGFYGDRTNLVKGLIDRQATDEAEIASLQIEVKRINTIIKSYQIKAAAFVIGLEVAVWIVKSGLLNL